MEKHARGVQIKDLWHRKERGEKVFGLKTGERDVSTVHGSLRAHSLASRREPGSPGEQRLQTSKFPDKGNYFSGLAVGPTFFLSSQLILTIGKGYSMFRWWRISWKDL